jgi:hypothetical protein
VSLREGERLRWPRFVVRFTGLGEQFAVTARTTQKTGNGPNEVSTAFGAALVGVGINSGSLIEEEALPMRLASAHRPE